MNDEPARPLPKVTGHWSEADWREHYRKQWKTALDQGLFERADKILDRWLARNERALSAPTQRQR